MEKLIGILLISSTILVTACSVPPYKSSAEQNSAQITFTSFHDEYPDLELRLRGKTYAIDHEMIKLAKPKELDKKLGYKIPANEQIELVYEVSQITGATVDPVLDNHVIAHIATTQEKPETTPTIGHTIDFEQEYNINICTTDFNFTAEQNKHYIAFLEQSDGIVCRISVMEVISSRGNGHDTYKQVNSTKPAS